MIYKAKKGAAAAAADTTWTRWTPTGATIDYGSAASNTLDAAHVSITDDGTETTITWAGGETWSTYKNPAKMAVWWIDTGYQWQDVTEVVAYFVMSSVPSDALKPIWGVCIGTGTDADAAGWHGGHACMGGTSDGDPGVSGRTNINNVAFVTPATTFLTAKAWFDVSKQSATEYRTMAVSTWPYNATSGAFHTTYGNATSYDAARLASPTDTLYLGVCLGTFASSAPASDITAVGKLHYTVNNAGDPG